jgi:hypothetical protein
MFKEKTYMGQLVGYIKRNLKKGYTKESLRWALISQGNSKIEVEKAFKRVDEELAEKAPELKTKPTIKYEIIEPKEYRTKIVKNSPRSLFSRFLGRLGLR